MSRSNASSRRSGFTLVEMLVIAPIALLIITGFVALMVTMVGDVIASRTRNVMTYDIQSALNTIERDVRLSTQFLVTSGNLPSPQGKNGATSAFTSTSGDLILGEIATDKNPIDPMRGFIHYDEPFLCTKPAEVYKNPLFFTTVIYTIRDDSLWRRTYVPSPSGTLCYPPWQVNTCAPGYPSSATRCQTNDSEILSNVKSFDVSYYANPEDTVALSDASATSAESIVVTLESEKTAAGRTITVESSGRSTKLSDRDINEAPPSPPTVTGSNSGSEAIFTWPVVPEATSYLVQYAINGGDFITASENTTDTSFSIKANRGDTVSVKVFGRNTTGVSADTSSNNASVTIPLWNECNLQNGWVNYTSGYQTCGYTLTKDGVVMLKGHIKGGSLTSGVGLFQLPPELRPEHRLIFQTVISPHESTRVDVDTDGWVRLINGTSSDYLGFDGVYFISRTSLYKWTNLTTQNGWHNYGSPFAPIQSTMDDSGRVHVRGLVSPGTVTFGTPIAQLPSGSQPSNYIHLSARGDSYNSMGITGTGSIVSRGVNTPFLSTQAMFYPSSYTGWQNLSVVSGMPADGQIGNGWRPYDTTGIYVVPQFTKSDDGIVTVRGLISSGATANLTFIAKLPPGYRPLETVTFIVPSASGRARLDVGESGWIVVRVADATWTSLSGISFMGDGT